MVFGMHRKAISIPDIGMYAKVLSSISTRHLRKGPNDSEPSKKLSLLFDPIVTVEDNGLAEENQRLFVTEAVKEPNVTTFLTTKDDIFNEMPCARFVPQAFAPAKLGGKPPFTPKRTTPSRFSLKSGSFSLFARRSSSESSTPRCAPVSRDTSISPKSATSNSTSDSKKSSRLSFTNLLSAATQPVKVLGEKAKPFGPKAGRQPLEHVKYGASVKAMSASALLNNARTVSSDKAENRRPAVLKKRAPSSRNVLGPKTSSRLSLW